MYEFLDTSETPMLKQDADNLNIPVTNRDTENIVKFLPIKNIPSPKTGINTAELY